MELVLVAPGGRIVKGCFFPSEAHTPSNSVRIALGPLANLPYDARDIAKTALSDNFAQYAFCGDSLKGSAVVVLFRCRNARAVA